MLRHAAVVSVGAVFLIVLAAIRPAAARDSPCRANESATGV